MKRKYIKRKENKNTVCHSLYDIRKYQKNSEEGEIIEQGKESQTSTADTEISLSNPFSLSPGLTDSHAILGVDM